MHIAGAQNERMLQHEGRQTGRRRLRQETNIFIADWIPWREILRNVPSLRPEREGDLIFLFSGAQTK